MKRSQLVEENYGHCEYEVQCPIALPKGATLEQGSTPRSFGTTTRRLRFLRASSRENSAEMTLEGMAIRVLETSNTLHRSRADVPALWVTEQGLNRRASFTEVGTIENSNCSFENNRRVAGADYGALDTTEDSMFEVYENQAPETVPSTRRLMGEISQTTSSGLLRELVSGADPNEPQQDHGEDRDLLGGRGKENRDPLGDWGITPRRSPLPEWFPRKPLQDITNVLVFDLDDEHPQPKKKRNRKIGTTLAPLLITLSEAPVNKAPTITQPKPSRCAASRQASNLRKNFR